MRQVNTKGASASDNFWSKTYAHRDLINSRAVHTPTKVTIKKSNGDEVDITEKYVQGFL